MLKRLVKLPRNVHEYLFSEQRFVSTVKRSLYLAWGTALVLMIMVLVMIMKPAPVIPNTTDDYDRLTRVQFFARNYFTLWSTGTEADASAIKTMLADPSVNPGTWNTEPLDVSDLNVADITSSDQGPTTQWVVTIGATLIKPGSDAPQRNYFVVTVLEQNDSMKALTLPRIANHARPDLTAVSAYPNSVGPTTPLGTSVSNFIAAYFTSESGSLGRYVSSNFKAEPIVGSPYTSTEIVTIHSTRTVDTKGAKEGTRVELLVTVKAAISLSTFNTLDVPITASAVDNGQWTIDSIDTLSNYGQVQVGQPN